MKLPIGRVCISALCCLGLLLGSGAPPAQAAPDDPLFILRPVPPIPRDFFPIPPPAAKFEGACGLGVDGAGNFYVSDYYHQVIDVYSPSPTYQTQAAGVDPIDGPCGLALDSAGNLYVNNFHRNVVKFAPQPNFGSGAAITEANEHPTGVAVDLTDSVYVNQRTHVAVYNSSGTGIGTLGLNQLEDSYGAAVSGYSLTKGFVYVADAGDNTVKVWDPSVATAESPPLAEIDGSETPLGQFSSLRDAALGVDRITGEIYVTDNLQPFYAEHPETVVYVFNALGVYEGRLKYSIDNAVPPGLAVDNSATSTQGRVYLTSGNTELSAVYAYPPHAATGNSVPLPSSVGAVGGGGGGSGFTADPIFPALPASPQGGDAALAAPAAALSGSPGQARPGHRLKKRKRTHHRRHRNRR